MRGQVTIHDCSFCGEPASQEVVIRPSEYRSVKGIKKLVHHEVKGWVCPTHTASVQQDIAKPLESRLAAKAKGIDQLDIFAA